MNEFKSYSQAGQDRFAYELIGEKGIFFDIGANHPIEKNNTYGLEQIGWMGLLFERDDYCVELCKPQRTSPVIQVDATTANWRMIWGKPMRVDYVSLDVDMDTEVALRNLLEANTKFNVLTVEHDKYRFGPEPQIAMRKMLDDAGYVLICSDVCDKEYPFEDWWVSPKLQEKAARFKSENCDWRKIFHVNK